ncbi:MAG: NUDIX domain-containing protein [Candidatus Aenigmarchaeota archaeon]|nr:NUDIX domain-containing protein [Candidatus Aenigmarchaeota archaeon]
MTEYVDTVDENDNVIGKTTKKEAHQKKLIHRIVHILIINSEGDLLIQKRSMNMSTYPGYWTSPAAGHVTSGDDYEETAHRELKEELSINAKLEKIGLVRSYEDEHMQNIMIFLTNHNGPFKVDDNEIEKIEFVKIGKLKREIRLYVRKFSPAFERVFKKLCEVKGL